MTGSGPDLTLVSFAVAAASYLVLACFFVLSWKGRGTAWKGRTAGLALVVAAAVTGLWAGAEAWAEAADGPALVADLLSIGRSWMWLAVAYLVLRLLSSSDRLKPHQDPLLIALVGLVAISLLAVVGTHALILSDTARADLRFAAHLGLSVFGLVLIENLYQTARGGAIWAVKHLLIGLGALFAFDLFMYADALLLKRASDVTQAAQPLVAVLVVPLLLVAAARLRDFNIRVHVTRRVAVHTAALVSCGVYLLAAAAVAMMLRRFDLTWGPTLQVVFLVGALVVLAVLLSSAQARAHGRHFIERNFFSFAYDYREEWLKLVRIMSDSGQPSSLAERAIRASAEIFHCRAGALLLRRPEDGKLHPAGFWHWPRPADLGPPPAALLERVSIERPAVELRLNQRLHDDDAAEAASRAWLSHFKEPWILTGLHVHGRLIGVVLIGRPMLSRRLGWEDYDLLSVLASQIGSYLAVEQMTRQLAEAQRFEQVSRRFSFVAHDLKNLITQLSIIVDQAQRHADNPEFFQDALTTVGESVEKMRTMVLRLRERSADDEVQEPVDLAALLKEQAASAGRRDARVTCRLEAEDLVVLAERDQLNSILQNLIDNACEAQGGQDAEVEIALARSGDTAVVEVSDDGPGMSARFIEDELFSPFSSTKPDGFGIGMYQCRLSAERWGGSIEVHSKVGRGTTVRLMLPVRPSSADLVEPRLTAAA